jgi:hypothetical protein
VDEQPFDPLEPEAAVARTLIELDPRRVRIGQFPARHISLQHAVCSELTSAQLAILSRCVRGACVSFFTHELSAS